MITRVLIENFKSIERVDLPVGPVTLLVGPNSAGKSNVIDALRFVRDILRHGLDQAVSDRHGIDSIRRWSKRGAYNVTITVHVSKAFPELPEKPLIGRYSLTLGSSKGNYVVRREDAKWDQVHEFWYEDENGEEHQMDFERETVSFSRRHDAACSLTTSTGTREIRIPYEDEVAIRQSSFGDFRGLVDEIVGFEAYSIFPNTLRQTQPPSNDRRLSANGDNLTSIFKMMERQPKGKQARAEILSMLRRLMPRLDDIAVRGLGGVLLPLFRLAEPDGTKHNFNVSQVSDGTLRVLGLLTALYQPNIPGLIALEEPEQTVHPGVLGLLADAILEASARTQVLVTTHSPYLVDRFDPDVVRVVDTREGITSVAPVTSAQMKAVQNHLFSLGELMAMEGLAQE